MRRFNNVRLARQGIAVILLFGVALVANANQMMRALPSPATPQPVAALPAVQRTIIPNAVVTPAAISPAAIPLGRPTKQMSLTGTSPAPINLVKCNVDSCQNIFDKFQNQLRLHPEKTASLYIDQLMPEQIVHAQWSDHE